MELPKRDLLVSKTWIQAVALVVVFGFFVLGLLAYRTYSGEAPIPARVLDQRGTILFTGADVTDGSIFGHGAYLGPDYTADYLRRSATTVFEVHGGQQSDSANSQTVAEFKTNRYDPASDTLTFTEAQSTAYNKLKDYYQSVFNDPSTRSGLRPHAISERRDTDRLTAFFAWSAWVASATRPGTDYSYTNNWPPEPLSDYGPDLIDASGAMVDGTTFNGPVELRRALVARRDAFLNTMTERMLAYSIDGKQGISKPTPALRMPAVRAALLEAKAQNYSWSSLIAAIVKAPFGSH